MKCVPSYPDSHVPNQSSVVIVTADDVGPAAPVSLCVHSRPSVNTWDLIGPCVGAQETSHSPERCCLLKTTPQFLRLHKPWWLCCGEQGIDTIRRCDWFVAIGQQLAANLSFHNWALSQAWSNNQYLHGCNLLLTWKNGWDQDRKKSWVEFLQQCFNHVIYIKNTPLFFLMRTEGHWQRNWLTVEPDLPEKNATTMIWWRTWRRQVKATGILQIQGLSLNIISPGVGGVHRLFLRTLLCDFCELMQRQNVA